MSEPDKELLRVSDILRWIPGVTEYAIEKQVAAGNLKLKPIPGARGRNKTRFFLKSNVREVFLS